MSVYGLLLSAYLLHVETFPLSDRHLFLDRLGHWIEQILEQKNPVKIKKTPQFKERNPTNI